MAFIPRFKIMSADGNTEVYVFPVVQNTNLPKTPRDTITITNLRSQGAVVIDGGIKPFDAIIEFILFNNTGDYEDIIAAIDGLESAIPVNTPFILRMDKTAGTYYDYNIKRLVPFDYPNINEDLRLYRQKVTATFLANAW